jgi:ParB family chromosome partitioning protein
MGAQLPHKEFIFMTVVESPPPPDYATSHNAQVPQVANAIVYLPVNAVVASEFQPRSIFEQVELQALSDDIKASTIFYDNGAIKRHGVRVPIDVRPHSCQPNKYELNDGERRLRATIMAGINIIPAIVQDTEDLDSALTGLKANILRAGLNPMDQAKALHNVAKRFGLSQTDLALRVYGKKGAQPVVSRLLAFCEFPEDVQNLIRTGEWSQGHGDAVISLRNEPEVLSSMAIRSLNADPRWTVAQLRDAVDEYHTDKQRAEGQLTIDDFASAPSSPAPSSATVEAAQASLSLPEETPRDESTESAVPATQTAPACTEPASSDDASEPDQADDPTDPATADDEPLGATETDQDEGPAADPGEDDDEYAADPPAEPAAAPAPAPAAVKPSTPAPAGPATPAAPTPAPSKAANPAPAASTADGKETQDLRKTVQRLTADLSVSRQEIQARDQQIKDLGEQIEKARTAPAGFTRCYVKSDVLERAQALNLWPLPPVIEALRDAGFASILDVSAHTLHPEAIQAGATIEEWIRTGEVLTPPRTELLHRLYPERERTTYAMVASVLLVELGRQYLKSDDAREAGIPA